MVLHALRCNAVFTVRYNFLRQSCNFYYYLDNSAIAEGPREHLSVEILQLQNISLENPIVWLYLRDSAFSRFDTIPECDRHTHRQTDGRTDTAMRCAVKIDHIALHTKYNYQATSVG